jgi:hypothetical protein
VRSDLLGIVASAKNYQEDWQRRIRDLRFLGWDYQHEKRYDRLTSHPSRRDHAKEGEDAAISWHGLGEAA